MFEKQRKNYLGEKGFYTYKSAWDAMRKKKMQTKMTNFFIFS